MVCGLSAEQRSQIAQPGALQIAGLEQGEDSLRFRDNHFAAIASDNPPFEAIPPATPDKDDNPGMMHGTIIGLWGMPIGEMFQLTRTPARLTDATSFSLPPRHSTNSAVWRRLRMRWRSDNGIPYVI